MQEPFDDRTERDPDLPSMNEVAREMNVTIIKLKRLLITGGYYSSATSRDVQRLVKAGKGIEEICETLNIRPSSFYANIPYSKGAYNLKEPSLCADQNARSRRRKKAVEGAAGGHLVCLCGCPKTGAVEVHLSFR